ncbi:MAG: ABC transporter ATP-binding protein [Ktedonobacterales bacterium]
MARAREPETAIEVHELVKRYAKAPKNAVDGVSFSVRRGEIFGLLGPNGTGKTTTIGILTTFVRQTSGAARTMGIDVVADPMSVKQRIAVVPQQSNLDRSLKVRDILTFHAAYHGMPRGDARARADALLAELGLADRAKDKVSRYSGGMAQRLMIARALMHSPDVLFLDEPTNNLDPQSRLFLWDRIRALNAQGLTILLTTHDMEEADQLCERIAIMDHGKILVNDSGPALKKLIPGGIALELRVLAPEAVASGPAADASGDAHDSVLAALRALPGVTRVDHVDAKADAAPNGKAAGAGAQWGGAGGAGGWGGNGNGNGGAGSGLTSATDDDTTLYRIYSEDAGSLVVAAAQAVAAAGAEVRDLHLKKPSLEDVFIYLTGRNLR